MADLQLVGSDAVNGGFVDYKKGEDKKVYDIGEVRRYGRYGLPEALEIARRHL